MRGFSCVYRQVNYKYDRCKGVGESLKLQHAKLKCCFVLSQFL